jgi:Heterokaryon incompatibility protein (HET)
VQDDQEDVRQQVEQMGEIYRQSYFTIFAISGNDANYGLPGVRVAPRKFRQVVVNIGHLRVSNTLPWMEEEDLLFDGAWGSRGWTFQERFFAQRGVFIGDYGVIINCLHTYSPEDEHCTHSLTREEGDLTDGTTIFYSGQDKRCKPYIMNSTAFDTYTEIISEYTQRHLTYQTDALAAFLGVRKKLERGFTGVLLHGLPIREFDAALLWSPVGTSSRRCDLVSNTPLFPSWSWLGWVGPAAWPWAMERDSFVSTVNSPLVWQDATAAAKERPLGSASRADDSDFSQLRDSLRPQSNATPVHSNTDYAWFTSDDLCLPPSKIRARQLQIWAKSTADHLGVCVKCNGARNNPKNANAPIFWPDGRAPTWKYGLPGSHRLSFRTLCINLNVVGRPFQRARLYNMQLPIFRMAVCDESSTLVGYIDVPHPETGAVLIAPGTREFAVLSRSTIDGQFEPAPDALVNRRRGALTYCITPFREAVDSPESYEFTVYSGKINEKGNFDARTYDETRPWCMFNVMMIKRVNGVAYREAIGRVHVDAVLASRPTEKIIDLE